MRLVLGGDPSRSRTGQSEVCPPGRQRHFLSGGFPAEPGSGQVPVGLGSERPPKRRRYKERLEDKHRIDPSDTFLSADKAEASRGSANSPNLPLGHPLGLACTARLSPTSTLPRTMRRGPSNPMPPSAGTGFRCEAARADPTPYGRTRSTTSGELTEDYLLWRMHATIVM